MMKCELAPIARHELFSASEWYEARRAGLGSAFLDEFQEVLVLISEYPEIVREREAGIRKLLMKRFPYHVVYIVEAKVLTVIGVWYARSDRPYR